MTADPKTNSEHNNSATVNWRQAERGSAWAMRLMAWLALTLGRRISRVILVLIVGFFWLSARQARQVSRQFLRIATAREINWHDTFKHIYYFAATVLDRVYLLAGKTDKFQVNIQRIGDFSPIYAGSGGLFLTSHLGSFEVMNAIGKDQRQMKIKFLMDKQQGARVGAVLNKINPEFLQNVIDARGNDIDMMLKIRSAIQSGHLVGVMADRLTEQDSPVSCEFLGKTATLPTSPWLLACMLDVPVIVCFGLYRGGNRYDLYLERLDVPKLDSIATLKTAVAGHNHERKPSRRELRDAQVQQLAQDYADRLAYHAQQAPYNWFNFYPFWQLQPPPTAVDNPKFTQPVA